MASDTPFVQPAPLLSFIQPFSPLRAPTIMASLSMHRHTTSINGSMLYSAFTLLTTYPSSHQKQKSNNQCQLRSLSYAARFADPFMSDEEAGCSYAAVGWQHQSIPIPPVPVAQWVARRMDGLNTALLVCSCQSVGQWVSD